MVTERWKCHVFSDDMQVLIHVPNRVAVCVPFLVPCVLILIFLLFFLCPCSSSAALPSSVSPLLYYFLLSHFQWCHVFPHSTVYSLWILCIYIFFTLMLLSLLVLDFAFFFITLPCLLNFDFIHHWILLKDYYFFCTISAPNPYITICLTHLCLQTQSS